MTKSFTRLQYCIMLYHIMQSETVADIALDRLEPRHIVEMSGRKSFGLVFKVIGSYRKRYDSLPDLAVIVTEIRRFVKEHLHNDTEVRDNILKDVRAFIEISKVADERSEEMARDMITYIVDECILTPELHNILDEAKESEVIEGLGERITNLEDRKRSLSGGRSFTGIFDDDDTFGERVPTNIPWLDSRFGGGRGLVKGSTIGIIAPQGTGKTSLGIQLAVGQALAGSSALLVLAEEGLSRSMRYKIQAAALGFSYTELEETKGDLNAVLKKNDIPKEIADKKIEMMQKNFNVLDLVDKENDLEAIQDELQHLMRQDRTPVYTYVDWAGVIADKMVGSKVKGRTFNTKEEALKTISYTLSRYAQRTDSIVAISQQMAGRFAARGPFAINDHYCAADCRGFTEPMKYVLVINPQDSRTRLSLMNVAKARDDKVCQPFPIRLRGEIPVIEDASNQFSMKGKRFVSKRSSLSKDRVPSEV